MVGVKPLRSAVSPARAIQAENEADKEIHSIAQDMANNAADGAPVLTGHLRDTIRNGVVKQGHLHYQLVTDVYGIVPYLWRQNFEHQSRRYFFTSAFNREASVFSHRLSEAVGRAWR